jgi:acetyl esterase
MRDDDDDLSAGQNPPAVMDRNRPLLDQAQGYIYQETNGIELAAYAFAPRGHSIQHPRPAILFFHSSAWDSGLISQFAPHCLHFAQRGLVAITFEYRLSNRHHTGPVEAMADARSAVRWVRSNARELGIEPDRIVGAGGSAGAQLMLGAAMMGPDFDDPGDDLSVSCAPNALVLFDPVVDVHSRQGFGGDRFPDAGTARLASPILHVRKGLPPMILFHGTQDRLVPVKLIRRFVRKMRRWPQRNICELVPFSGCGHSFFNFNVDPRLFEATINLADRFLVARGFLNADAREETDNRL